MILSGCHADCTLYNVNVVHLMYIHSYDIDRIKNAYKLLYYKLCITKYTHYEPFTYSVFESDFLIR